MSAHPRLDLEMLPHDEKSSEQPRGPDPMTRIRRRRSGGGF